MLTTKGLREKRFKLSEDARALLKAAADDGREGLRSEEQEQWEKIHAEIDALTTHIQFREKQDELEERLSKTTERKADGNPVGDETRGGGAEVPRNAAVDISRLRRGQEESADAFRSWFLAGSPFQ